MKHFFCLLITILAVGGIAKGQHPQIGLEFLKNISPVPPTEQGLLRYLDFPVNNTNGSPNITIPLYEIKTRELSLPISLSYDATGIKVNQEAGNVGLAWSLNAGGIINRTIRGMEDNGTFWTGVFPRLQSGGFNPQSRYEDYELARQLIQKSADGVPDLYSYNFSSYSGRFIYGKGNTAYLMPQKKLRIETYGSSPFNGIPYYKITAEDGTQYYFEQVGKIDVRTSYSVNTSGYTWYLTKIQSASNTDQITLEYQDTAYEHFPSAGQTIKMDLGAPCDVYQGTTTYSSASIQNLGSSSVLRGKQLSKITFQEGTVEFDLDWQREDKWGDLSFVKNPKVNGIKVKNKQGEVVKQVRLEYDYYNKGTSTAMTKRLRLDGVRFCKDCEPGTADYRYAFSYNAMPLPALGNKGVDHWGYYNGKPNTTFIPTYPYVTDPGICFPQPPYCICPSEQGVAKFNGANRFTDPELVKAGILEKIQYPTGGTTQFVYEAHETASTQYIASLSTGGSYASFTNVRPHGQLGEEHSELIEAPATTTADLCAQFTASYSFYPLTSTDHNVQKWRTSGKFVEVSSVDGEDYRIIATVASFQLTYQHTTETKTVTIQPGKKYMVIIQSYLKGAYVNGSVTFQHTPVMATQRNYVGGLRLQKKLIQDPLTDKQMVTRYQYNQPYYLKPQYETGSFVYNSVGTNTCGEACLFDQSLTYYNPRQYLHLTANVAGTESYMNYGEITALEGENGENGKTVSHYLINWQSNPNGMYTWQVGQVLDQTTYSATGKPLQKIVNEYDHRVENCPNGNCIILGMEVASMGEHPCLAGSDESLFNAYSKHFSIRSYVDFPEWFYLKKSTQTSYDVNSSQTLETVTEYTYANPAHLQLTQSATTTSETGKKIISTYTYPADYTTITSGVLAQMKAKHMHDAVIESLTQVQRGTESRVQGGTFVTYEDIDPNLSDEKRLIVPTKSQGVALASPKLNFTASLATGNAADASYQDQQFLNYNPSTGNLVEARKAHNQPVSYLWGYDQAYLVAEIKNSSLAQVSYSSFEDQIRGATAENWFYFGNTLPDATAKTGKQVYSLADIPANPTLGMPAYSGAISRPNASLGTYTLSYWAKGGTVSVAVVGGSVTDAFPARAADANGWVYYQKKVVLTATTNSLTLSGPATARLDELRLYPAKSQMTTYTYEPLIGMSSATDVNGFTTYYEYDELGRLKRLKDQEGNIIKHYVYHYKAQ